MRYLKNYNESKAVSYFDTESWKKFLPKELHLVTHNGNWTLTLPESKNNMSHATNITHLMNCIQINYAQNTPEREDGDVLRDGEPDQLEFDITLVKNNDGTSANPDTLKLSVDITYGDSMACEFNIEKPNKVTVLHYTGIGTKINPLSFFGFEDESLQALVDFFNSWGYSLTTKDFTFLDKYPDSYIPQKTNETIMINPSFNGECILIVNNSKPQENRFLDNLIKYLDFRAIPWKLASTPEEVEKMNSEFNIIGAISTGSEYRITDLKSDKEFTNSEKAIQISDCPIFAICYGMQSMAKYYGANVIDTGNFTYGSYPLTKFEEHELFDDIDLENTQVSFSFNDCLENCPDGFKVIGEIDGIIAAIANDEKKHYGTLFHPENIEYTYQILDNFINICDGGRMDAVEELKGKMPITNVVESYSQFIKTNTK